jgi:hypothetical protein
MWIIELLNLNYTPETLVVQILRGEWGRTRTNKKVECHWSNGNVIPGDGQRVAEFLRLLKLHILNFVFYVTF